MAEIDNEKSLSAADRRAVEAERCITRQLARMAAMPSGQRRTSAELTLQVMREVRDSFARYRHLIVQRLDR